MTFLSQMPFLNIILMACLLLGLASIFLNVNKKREYATLDYIFIFTFILYSLLLVSILFYPSVKYSNEHIDINYFQVIPFKSITDFIINKNYIQILGGFMITAPMIPLLLLNLRKLSLKTASVIALVIVLLIEPLQLMINIITNYPNKIIDIDDFILNSIGLLLSICLVKIYHKIFKPDVYAKTLKNDFKRF